MVREKCGLLAGPHTVTASSQSYTFPSLSVLSYDGNSAHAHSYVVGLYRNAQSAMLRHRWAFSCIVLGTVKDNYDMSASVFVVQFNGFLSLTS